LGAWGEIKEEYKEFKEYKEFEERSRIQESGGATLGALSYSLYSLKLLSHFRPRKPV
jgi:hypothetical protein